VCWSTDGSVPIRLWLRSYPFGTAIRVKSRSNDVKILSGGRFLDQLVTPRTTLSNSSGKSCFGSTISSMMRQSAWSRSVRARSRSPVVCRSLSQRKQNLHGARPNGNRSTVPQQKTARAIQLKRAECERFLAGQRPRVIGTGAHFSAAEWMSAPCRLHDGLMHTTESFNGGIRCVGLDAAERAYGAASKQARQIVRLGQTILSAIHHGFRNVPVAKAALESAGVMTGATVGTHRCIRLAKSTLGETHDRTVVCEPIDWIPAGQGDASHPKRSSYLNNHSALQIIACQVTQGGRNVLEWKDLPYRCVDSAFLRQSNYFRMSPREFLCRKPGGKCADN
jgi:hypothetical protein